MALSESTDLVLVGKPGIGKSATGNSILGIKAFQENASGSPSVSREPVVHVSFLENKVVRVVDGLDLVIRDISIFDRQLDKAIRLLKNGFSALLIVVRSDVPFSKEEAKGLEVLKDRLGQNIIQDFGICAVTYGDNFQLDVREKKVANFEDWCKRQTGDLRKLFEECRFRCVLFNNLAVERASRDNLNRFVLEMSEENLRQGHKKKFEMSTATNIDKPSELQHPGNLSSVHDGYREVMEELTQKYQTQKAQLHSGAISSKEPRFDTGAVSSKKPRFDTGAVSSKEPRFDTGAISSKEPRFDTGAISSKEPRFDTGAISSKEPRFDTGAISSKEPRFDTGAVSSKEPRFDTGAISSKEPRFDTGAVSSKEPRFDTDAISSKEPRFDIGAVSSKEPRFDTGAISSIEPRFDTGAISSKEPRFDIGAVSSKEPRFDTGAVSSKEPRFDTGAVSSKEPRFDTGAVSSKEPRFDTGAVSSKEPRFDTGAVSSKEPRFDTGAVSSKEPRFDTGAVSSKNPRFDTGAVSSKEPRFDTGAVSSKEPRFDAGAVSSKEPKFDTGAISSKEPKFDTGAISSIKPKFDTGAISSIEPKFDAGAVSSIEPRFDNDNLEAESEQFSRKIESRLVEIVRLRNKEIRELIEETQRFAEKIRVQAKLPFSQRFLTRLNKLNGSLRSLLQEIPLNAEQSPERVVQTLESDELISGGAAQISGRDEQISRKDDQISRRDEQNTVKQIQVARPEVKQKPTGVQTNIPSTSSCNKATLDQRDDIQKIKMREPSDIDLLLIGKTGNGKSATGNFILRRNSFKTRSSSSSVTKEVAYEVSEFQGRIIKVVDAPGVGDTRMDNEKAVNLVLKAMEYAIAANPRGYHAFLLVTRFGGRFTAEDQDTIAFLKKIFGETFVRSYCILVLTCGDNFETESKETGESFEDWCKEQEGVFAELMEECDNRIILFDNVTKDERKKCDQIEKLIQMVDNLRFQGYRYTDENFNKAKAARERTMIEAKKPMIQEETMNETSLIIQKIQELQLQDDLKMKIQFLEGLQTRAENLYQSISSQDLGIGALHDLCETAKSVQRTVDEEIKFCHRMLKERERIKEKEEKTRKMFEDQIRKQNEDFEKQMKEEQLKEEERRRFDKELEMARYEAEEKRRREREEQEERLHHEHLEEQNILRQRVGELESLYMEAKAKNDEGFFDKVVSVVSWPYRKIKGWLFD